MTEKHSYTIITIMRNCYKCKQTKPIEEFVKRASRASGYDYLCKSCKSLQNRANIDYSKEWRHNKFATDPEWRRKYSSRHEKDRVKDSARQKVQYAVRTGKLTPGSCYFLYKSEVSCGEGKSVPHHEDYSKPLEVVWMCQLHHRRYHLGELNVNGGKANPDTE